MRPEPGTEVRVEMTKWPTDPHWVYPGRYLGSDAHGEWIGFPAGTVFTRPGARFTAVNDQVGLVPAEVEGVRPAWLATFHGPGGYLPTSGGPVPIDLYVDMTTPARWEGPVLRAVDLDLDVVRGRSGRVWVDDEDEFAAHRAELAYPADIVGLALDSCALVAAATRDRRPPFDGETHLPWLEALAAD
jgi:uncharacterized protein